MAQKTTTRCSFIVWALICYVISIGVPGKTYSQPNLTLEAALARDFSMSSKEDGKWVYYREKGNIKQIDKPMLAARIPGYNFYQVTLTNYLGYHVNRGVCVVLFDSIHSKTVLVEPMWYGGCSRSLLKLFIGQKFDNKDALLSFLKELHELMQLGSGYKFMFTAWSDSLVTYDLGAFKGDTYTTGGNGITSTMRYNSDEIWRKIKIDIKDLTIVQYTEINPVTEEAVKTNKDTKTTKPQPQP